ncbi:hypothetical protein NL364_28840, partial [Klebsiella pneumoniae]|nr:hypothetical protein [Klebsiella pneumoniae]
RCISAVQNIFDNAGVNLKSIHLGEVETDSEIPENKFSDIQKNLEDIGFEIIKDATQQLIENIKNLIISKIGRLETDENFVLSNFLSNA